jgi:uncharacterized protein involved in outer membrane biogenesis
MKKWIFIGLGAVVVILIAIVVVVNSKLGPIVKVAVNTYGPKITGTQLKVNDVGISLFSGEAKLEKFFLGNPKGFKSPSALKVGSINVHLDESSLPKNTIVIKKVEVVGPEITYERRTNTDNFQSLLANVEKNMPQGESGKKEPEKQGPGKKLIIDDLIIKQGKVNLAVEMPGGMLAEQHISTDLPDIELKDIGKNNNGSSPAEVTKEIFEAMYTRITAPNVIGALNDQLKKLEGSVTGEIGGAAQEGLKEATGAVQGTGKEAGVVSERVEGLFKKKS